MSDTGVNTPEGPAKVHPMIEAVARAIAAQKRNLPTNDHAVEVVWKSYCGQARAAIAAMREPTTDMLAKASSAMSDGKRPTVEWVSNKTKHAIRYQAMIDRVLDKSKADQFWEQMEAAE